VRAVIAAMLLLAGGCPSPPVATPPDLAVPIDLALPSCNGTTCAADEYCLRPCALFACFTPEDGGRGAELRQLPGVDPLRVSVIDYSGSAILKWMPVISSVDSI
jgi:hypothetical protein